jgi:hypothetical protein
VSEPYFVAAAPPRRARRHVVTLTVVVRSVVGSLALASTLPTTSSICCAKTQHHARCVAKDSGADAVAGEKDCCVGFDFGREQQQHMDDFLVPSVHGE